MRVVVLGSGMVGRALAARLDELGHDVTVGTRDPEATLARVEPGHDGQRAGEWAAAHPGIGWCRFDAVESGIDLCVNATDGNASVAAIRQIPLGVLDGVPLLDIGNRLDAVDGARVPAATAGAPSLAEQIQEVLPGALVVKALNTVTAALMVDPARLAGGGHTCFISGDDAGSKALVHALLTSFGWTDIVDLGGLETARAAEMMMPIWLAAMSALGLPPDRFAFRLVR